MISLKVGSRTYWYRSIPRSGVYSELSGIEPGGRLDNQEVVCPLLCRVRAAGGIRWRSGCSLTHLVSGRTTGTVELCACHAFLRRLYSRPAVVGFARGGMGRCVECVRSRAGYRYARLRLWFGAHYQTAGRPQGIPSRAFHSDHFPGVGRDGPL